MLYSVNLYNVHCFGGHAVPRHGHALQIGLVDMLYRKSLRITGASKGRLGVGAIVNLQSNDASKLWGMAQFLHILWSGPFQVMLLPTWFYIVMPSSCGA